MRWLQHAIELLLENLGLAVPPEFVTFATWTVLGIAAASIVWRLGHRYRHRHTLFVEEPVVLGIPENKTGAVYRERIGRTLQTIHRVHTSEDLFQQGERTGLGKPELSQEVGLETLVNATLETNKLLEITGLLPELIWPKLRLETALHSDGGLVYCHATVRRGNKAIAMFSDRCEGHGLPTVVDLAEKVAYQAIFFLASDPKLNRGVVLGTASPEAFRLHTEALDLARVHTEPLNDSELDRLDATFARCCDLDPKYALPWYNRGVIHYLGQAGAERIQRALDNFDMARQKAEARRDEAELEERDAAQRVLVNALCGMSQCYCQFVHRFADIDARLLENARRTARRAYELDPANPQALYALGFALHCTDQLHDIREGAPYLEKIVEAYPEQYDTVYNNLCYIYGKAGRALERRGEHDEAKEYYRLARLRGEVAARIAPPDSAISRYVGTNLGAVARMQGDYEGALQHYERVLGSVPEQSRYVEGLNEYAWVQFAIWMHRGTRDALELGLKYHGRALERASDANHAFKQMLRLTEFFEEEELASHALVSALLDEMRTDTSPERVSTWQSQLRTILGNTRVAPVSGNPGAAQGSQAGTG